MSESDFCGTGLGNTTAPPAGTPDWSNLAIYAATTNTGIKVSWNNVATLRNAVAYFTLYRNSLNDESGATAIWSGNGTSYHDPSGSLAVGVTYYYWLQCTALNGFSSPWFGPASAAMRTEQDNLVEVMQNQVLSSSFFPELVQGLDRITGLEISLIANRNDLDINDALITAALEAVRADLLADGVVNANGFLNLSTEIANVAYRFDTFGAQLGPAIALIQSEQIAYAAADIAFAQDINTVQAQLDTPESNGSTLWSGVTENKEALVTIDGKARAKYSLKVEVDSNGNQAIGGIVLGAESDGTPEGTSSTVLILADTFGIISPSPTDAGDYIVPFTVGTDDVTGASGVFMDSAYVNNLNVETLQIAGQAVTVPSFTSFANPGGPLAVGGSIGSYGSTTHYPQYTGNLNTTAVESYSQLPAGDPNNTRRIVYSASGSPSIRGRRYKKQNSGWVYDDHPTPLWTTAAAPKGGTAVITFNCQTTSTVNDDNQTGWVKFKIICKRITNFSTNPWTTVSVGSPAYKNYYINTNSNSSHTKAHIPISFTQAFEDVWGDSTFLIYIEVSAINIIVTDGSTTIITAKR
jgi:hypothetical protein